MVHYAEVIGEREGLGRPLAGSLALHVSLLAASLGFAYLHGKSQPFGDPNAIGGGGVLISAVDQIPIASRGGEKSPIANDTKSMAPAEPVKERAKAKAEPDDDSGVAIYKNAKKNKKLTRQQLLAQYMKNRKMSPNQVTSSTGQALATPMVAAKGSGGVGAGFGSNLGARFGWYQQLVIQRIAEKWRTQDVDASLQNAPIVTVAFDILRDGSVRGVKIVQRSGNYSLDTSTRRAVDDAAPFQALPPEFEKSSASVEITFQFKR